MTTGLSDEDMDRIQQFVDTPAYKRTPELLLPEDADVLPEDADVLSEDGDVGGQR